MYIVLWIIAALAVSALLLLFLLQCRRGAPGWEAFEHQRYAHRGLHGEGAPENSVAAFLRAVERGFGAELDVHLLRDGSLAVFHDSALARMTGQQGFLEELDAQALARCRLGGTTQTIPLFHDILSLFEGTHLPLIVELKSFRGNHAALSAAVAAELDRFHVPCCIESFDPRCLRWFRRNRPDMLRGQLSQDFVHSPSGRNCLLDFLGTNLLSNFWTRPDFIAYRFEDRNAPALRICRRIFSVRCFHWTISSRTDLEIAERTGAQVIFEHFIP